MSLSDPLTLLREFTTAKRKVVIDGEHIVFGKTRFAKDAPTAYKSSTGEFYPVSWLLCLAQQEEPVNAGLYVKATTAAGVKPVAFLDRKKVLDYLHGRAEVGAPTIDFAAAPKVEPVSKEDVPMEEVPAEEAASAAEREEAAEAERAAAKAALLELLKQPIEPKAPAAAAAGAEAAAADAAADVEMEEAGGEAGAEDAAAAAPAEASDAASDAASESGDGGGSGGKKKKKEAQVKGARIMGAAKAFIRHEAHKTKAIVKREQRCARAQLGGAIRRRNSSQFSDALRPPRPPQDAEPQVGAARAARPLVPARPRGALQLPKEEQGSRGRAQTEAALVGRRRAAAAAGLLLRARAAAAVVVVKGDAPRLVVVLVQGGRPRGARGAGGADGGGEHVERQGVAHRALVHASDREEGGGAAEGSAHPSEAHL